MSSDISRLLRDWPYDPSRINARIVPGDDGADKLQLRLDLGMMQMELEGRPDGQRPEGRESWLAYYQDELAAHEAEHGSPEGWQLTPEDCARLHAEAVQYYHRYLSLAHLEDWRRVMRDTRRNLGCFEFVAAHAPDADTAWALQQFTPFVRMMNTRAAAMLLLRDGEVEAAIRKVDDGAAAIERFLRQHDRGDTGEESAELRALHEWREELQGRVPLPLREQLKRQMDAAIQREEYERAARLRDQIAELDRQV